jgi:hypothetical protein
MTAAVTNDYDRNKLPQQTMNNDSYTGIWSTSLPLPRPLMTAMNSLPSDEDSADSDRCIPYVPYVVISMPLY